MSGRVPEGEEMLAARRPCEVDIQHRCGHWIRWHNSNPAGQSPEEVRLRMQADLAAQPCWRCKEESTLVPLGAYTTGKARDLADWLRRPEVREALAADREALHELAGEVGRVLTALRLVQIEAKEKESPTPAP